MKGIILAGGHGTRLMPMTKIISKHLLPIYNKPMIFYSLSVLMLAKIKDILLICKSKDIDNYKSVLGNGDSFGISISYKSQDVPSGIPEAFIIGEQFIGNNKVALILGDNFYYGQGFTDLLLKAKKNNGLTIFTYNVKKPEKFGVIEYNKKGDPLQIIEKPKKPKSSKAVTGLYFFDNEVIKHAKSIKKSKRRELEITAINNIYLKKKKLNEVFLGRGYYWSDMGEFDSFLQTSNFVQTIENLQGFNIASLSDIALLNNWKK